MSLNNYQEEEEQFFDLIPKYRKRSKITKTKKSNHKHKYVKYIGITPHKYKNDFQYFPVEVCSVCQKIGEIGNWFTKQTNNHYSIILTNLKDIMEDNPDLDIKKFREFPW